MSLKIETWIERMRQAKNPGPVTRITAARNNRDIGWAFDIDEDTDFGELAERIESAGRDAGFVSCELRAFDAEGRFIGPLQFSPNGSSITVSNGGGGVPLPMGVEASITASLRSNRAFATLGLDAIRKAQIATERIMHRLEAENTALRKENEKLRGRIAEHWEILEKLHTHEDEPKQESATLERMGRMGETLVNALMARLLGRDGTPEGQSVEYRMAMTLFRSLASDLERVQKILPLLSEEEQVLALELMRSGDQAPATPEATKINGLAAASAAAAVNGSVST